MVDIILLGIIEGLTEFIPVSSTGHLILLGEVLGFKGESAASFEIFIQLGAILAVVVLYFPNFRDLLDFRPDPAGPAQFKGMRGISLLFVACLPAFVLGALLHGFIKEQLFSPLTVALALIVGGVVMIWLEAREPSKHRPTRELAQITTAQAFKIGLFQCLSLWPGISRSGATIIGAMLCGLERKLAAHFSFLVAVPVMSAAVCFDLLKSSAQLSSADLLPFATGFLVSFVTALVAIKLFIEWLNRLTLKPFAYYRIALGVLVLLIH